MLLISKIVIALIAPFGTAWCLGLLALGCAWRGHRRLARGLGAGALLWALVWATPAFSTALMLHLEANHPPVLLDAVPAAPAAVVLGGAIGAPSASRPFAELHEAADRVWHGARLYHAGKAPLLLLSGASDPDVTPLSEAQGMQLLLRDLGVPDSAMLLEGDSRNTRENAEFSAALLKQRGISRVLLVTSALHMPRALAQFRAMGLDVVPVAVDHTGPVALAGWAAWLPDAGALGNSGRAFKEILGRWLSRT